MERQPWTFLTTVRWIPLDSSHSMCYCCLKQQFPAWSKYILLWNTKGGPYLIRQSDAFRVALDVITLINVASSSFCLFFAGRGATFFKKKYWIIISVTPSLSCVEIPEGLHWCLHDLAIMEPGRSVKMEIISLISTHLQHVGI